MIGERRVNQKLEELAAVFNGHIRAKRYLQAKRCYEEARTVVVFLEMEEGEREAIFGKRGERGVILKEGLFREELVQKAYYEVEVKGAGGTRKKE